MTSGPEIATAQFASRLQLISAKCYNAVRLARMRVERRGFPDLAEAGKRDRWYQEGQFRLAEATTGALWRKAARMAEQAKHFCGSSA